MSLFGIRKEKCGKGCLEPISGGSGGGGALLEFTYLYETNECIFSDNSVTFEELKDMFDNNSLLLSVKMISPIDGSDSNSIRYDLATSVAFTGIENENIPPHYLVETNGAGIFYIVKNEGWMTETDFFGKYPEAE